MTEYTSEQSVEMFLEVMSQIRNIFEGIAQQDKMPMTEEERKHFDSECMNYRDYDYVLSGAYAEGFSYGMGIDSRHEPIPQDILDKANAIYKNLKSTPTRAMSQEERNRFADKWLAKNTLYATQKGALLHGLEIALKMKTGG